MSSSMHQMISPRQLLLFSLHSFMTLYGTPLAPPPPRFIYVTSVPGSLSETDPYDHWRFYSGARQNAVTWLLLLVGLGIPELMVIW
ncbi:hypothetical protein SADUNF_Sadunf04G0061000 [Salix dunnii]|uniref:Uncharacterized protein n=1 Tax=Salix dunnii TaxID=1413687 RepID=A0A835KDK5_9ROSI|nr:hypothetical protein SADUNF_Sadunf04G0061000 [Salix dunnii]